MKVLALMLVITTVVMLMGARVVSAESEDDPIKKYGIMKIFESCFGEELFKSLEKKKCDAEAKCQSLPGAGAERGPGGATAPTSLKATTPNHPQQGATDDFMYFNADRVRAVSMKIQAKVSNKTCVFKELGYMDSSDELLYDAIVLEIRTWGLEAALEQDIVESVTVCQKMAACVPACNIQVALTPALLRFKVFEKCFKQHKLNACMKKDLRIKRAEFDLSGLTDAADDDEKMLAVIWGNSLVGEGGYLS